MRLLAHLRCCHRTLLPRLASPRPENGNKRILHTIDLDKKREKILKKINKACFYSLILNGRSMSKFALQSLDWDCQFCIEK